jgi:defect-in-organelle-trafficking protein DotD
MKPFISHRFFVVLFICALVGCARTTMTPPINDPSDDAGIQLAETAVSTNEAMIESARVEKTIMPPAHDNTLTIPTAPALQSRASIDWSGPVEELTRRIADAAHYRLHVLGRRPSLPILISITVKSERLAAILREIDYQAKNRASIHIYPNRQVVELRYAKFYR